MRTVLLRALDGDGFVFFSNHESRKGRELAANPHAALLFPWHPLGRQVIVEGTATPLDAAASDAYWVTRPRGSQIAALASPQSQVIPDRAGFERRWADLEAELAGHDVPRPDELGRHPRRPRADRVLAGTREAHARPPRLPPRGVAADGLAHRTPRPLTPRLCGAAEVPRQWVPTAGARGDAFHMWNPCLALGRTEPMTSGRRTGTWRRPSAAGGRWPPGRTSRIRPHRRHRPESGWRAPLRPCPPAG